jgi:hypothetical protein
VAATGALTTHKVKANETTMSGKSFVTNTVLICFECKRVMILRGRGSWVHPVKLWPGITVMSYLTIVDCWRCRTRRGSSLADINLHVSENELMTSYDEITRSVARHVDWPILHHVESEMTMKGTTGCTLPSITSRRRAPIVDVRVILKRLDFVYTAMSLTTDRLTEPTTDFFKEGPTTNREHAFMRTKSTMYTVLFCPACVRNVVFKGPGTFMDVGRPTFEGTAMAMLFFVCCRSCKEIKSIEDEDLRMTVVMRVSVDSEAIKEISKCVPAKMKVFGSTPRSGIRQTDMEVAIMDRNVITDTIRDHCELLSAIGGMLVSPLPDFV